MTGNVCGVERLIRLVLGLVFFALGVFGELPPVGTWGVFILGVVALFTGLVGYCPVWGLLGINTCLTHDPGKRV